MMLVGFPRSTPGSMPYGVEVPKRCYLLDATKRTMAFGLLHQTVLPCPFVPTADQRKSRFVLTGPAHMRHLIHMDMNKGFGDASQMTRFAYRNRLDSYLEFGFPVRLVADPLLRLYHFVFYACIRPPAPALG
nr:hypothetical protein CFP56_11108 [Quercus suber]